MEKSVFKKRVEKLQILMEKNSLDFCIATPGTNFYYISGADAFRMERLIAAVVPVKDSPFIICPAFEEALLRKETFIDNFYPWEEDENPYELLKKVIKSTSGKIPSVGLEPTTYFETFVKIKEHFPSSEFKDTGKFFSDLRLKKSKEEIEAMKKAADFTEKSIKKSLKSLKEGMTEEEFKGHLEGAEKLVQFGKTSSYPHSKGGAEILKKEDVVLIDKCDAFDRYYSDITRTNHFGKVSDKFLKIWHIVREARDAAIEKAAPGVPCEIVDKAARDIIEKAGYGEYFIHRTGHGLGLDIHEEPYIVKGNKKLLTEGNVFTVEPGIYLPGEFGVRIEEDVVITEKGSMVSFRKA